MTLIRNCLREVGGTALLMKPKTSHILETSKQKAWREVQMLYYRPGQAQQKVPS